MCLSGISSHCSGGTIKSPWAYSIMAGRDLAKLLVLKYKSMIIQIKMDIKYNHAIIKYFKSYIAVIISVNKNNCFYGFATIFHPQRIRLCTSS